MNKDTKISNNIFKTIDVIPEKIIAQHEVENIQNFSLLKREKEALENSITKAQARIAEINKLIQRGQNVGINT